MTTAELVAEIDALLHRLRTARDILASINPSSTVKQAAPNLTGAREELQRPQEPTSVIPAPRQNRKIRAATPFEPNALINPLGSSLAVISAQEVATQSEERMSPLSQNTELQHGATDGTLDALIKEAAARVALGSTR